MKVGYLGPKNSFSFQAANIVFPEETLVAFASIPIVIDSLENKKVDYAVVPIENSLEGSVHATVDRLFSQLFLQVKEEIILPIHQQLMGSNNLEAPEKIMSHPQALAQTQNYLQQNFPNVMLEACASTTTAAQYVASHPEEKVLAIASEKAAKEYNLSILRRDIEDNALNQTRFWVLGGVKQKSAVTPATNKKITLFINLPKNVPGSLHKVLSAFAWRDIDLAKIESRPLKTSLGEYFFIIDVLVEDNQLLIDNAICEIEKLGGKVQNIGGYPVRKIN
ncbi:MAG TPA: prephenate dehydratase [Tetragenococcus sp.]|nr:prephenate dehydratase [Tetragenococcus sp.]